jgi:hypothetical protein
MYILYRTSNREFPCCGGSSFKHEHWIPPSYQQHLGVVNTLVQNMPIFPGGLVGNRWPFQATRGNSPA